MTNREKWLVACIEEERVQDEHICSIRLRMFLRDIARKIAKDPNYKPPNYEDTTKDLSPIVVL